MSTSVVQQDEQQVVKEMRSEHKRLRGSLAESGKKLKAWQASLGKGRFKRAYSAAGWTEAEVVSCLRALKNQRVEDNKCSPQVVDSVENEAIQICPADSCVEAPSIQSTGDLLNAQKLCDVINTNRTELIALALLSLLPYEVIRDVCKSTIESADGEKKSQITLLWGYLQQNFYQKEITCPL